MLPREIVATRTAAPHQPAGDRTVSKALQGFSFPLDATILVFSDISTISYINRDVIIEISSQDQTLPTERSPYKEVIRHMFCL